MGISAIGTVTVSTSRRKPNPYFRLLPDDAGARGEESVAFLMGLKAHPGGPMTVLWDRSRIHGRSGLVKAYLARHPEVVAEGFPGYAPEANPDEGVWGWIKYHRLPNNAPGDTAEPRFRLCREPSALRRRPDLSAFRHAEIPLRS